MKSGESDVPMTNKSLFKAPFLRIELRMLNSNPFELPMSVIQVMVLVALVVVVLRLWVYGNMIAR